MFDSITLYKTPLKPDYEKVISSITTPSSQEQFNSYYIAYLTLKYEPLVKSLTSTKNVIKDNNIIKIPIIISIVDAMNYNYVSMYETTTQSYTFYFVTGYYSQNEELTIFTLKRDAWANNYYDIISNSSYKNKIIRSHAPIGTKTQYNLKFNENIDYNFSFVESTNAPTAKQYESTDYDFLPLDLQTKIYAGGTRYYNKKYKILFAKITLTEPLETTFYPLCIGASTYTYYVPINVLDLSTNKFVSAIPQLNCIRQLKVNVMLDGYGNDDSWRSSISSNIAVNHAMAFDLSRVSKMLNKYYSAKNIVNVTLTYNYPHYYTFDAHNTIANFAGNVLDKGDGVPILGLTVDGTSIGGIQWDNGYYHSILSIEDINTIVQDLSNFSSTYSIFNYQLPKMNNDYMNKYPFTYYKIRLNNVFLELNTIDGKDNILKITETKGYANTWYRVYIDDKLLVYTQSSNKESGNLAVTRDVLDYYMATQGMSVGLSVLSSTAIGAATENLGGIMNTFNSVGKLYELYKTPDILTQAGNNAEKDIFLQDLLMVIQCNCIETNLIKEYKNDVYYKGILYELYQEVFKRTRKYFDYKRTENCSLPYIKNINDRLELERAFNNGITIVHAITNDAITNLTNLSLYNLSNEVI